MSSFSLSTIKNAALNVVFPPKCIVCGGRMDVAGNLFRVDCVCDKCRVQYESGFFEVCDRCNKSVATCTCGAKMGRIELSPIAKCFYYRVDKDSAVQNRVVYSLKYRDDRRIAKYLAGELAPSVKNMLESEGISHSECIFTFVPRRRTAINKHGFDQGARLARYLARAIFKRRSFAPLFIRIGGKEQKKLGALARAKNLTLALKLRPFVKKRIRGRTVCVVDDVVTSGATMRAAEKLLLSCGAKRVIFACVARAK